MNDSPSTFLFVVNPAAGNSNTNYRAEIEKFFDATIYQIHFFELEKDTQANDIKEKIKQLQPKAVVAVGGDGTVKLVAEALHQTDIALGIVPAGSANGMAKELGIPLKPAEALTIINNGQIQAIHTLSVNGQLCVHLSDIGINAWIVKKFHAEQKRGWKSYAKAAWKAIWRPVHLQVTMQINGQEVHRRAVMIVIANATKYGTGAIINPQGSLLDDAFEVVVVKKISLREILKMKLTHAEYDRDKTEVIQTTDVKIKIRRRPAHFQVDGEYAGKTNTVAAALMPGFLKVLVPATSSAD